MKCFNYLTINLFSVICFIFLTANEIYAQDSLYLVGTITGESYPQRITDVKGVGDVNGDGYDDFIVTHYFDRYAELYFGSPTLDLIPDIIFHYPNSEDSVRFFGIPGKIGDVNNDNYDDFTILGTFLADGYYPKGKVFLYFGGSTIDTIPAAEFNEPWIEDSFGEIYGVEDINKDGYDDFIITSPYNWTDARGRAYLFWGGDTISWDRSITFESDTLADFFGTSAATIGDVNKDGFDDIAISATAWTSLVDTAKVYIYYGGNPMNVDLDTIMVSGNAADEFGRIIKNSGDLNKDGLVDYCIASSESIYVYTGKDNDILKIKGYSLDSGGDINNDGYNDLIVGADWKIQIYFGSEIFDLTRYLNITDEDSLGYTANIFLAKDINNDGFDDILTISPYWPSPEIPVGKVFIFSYKKIVGVKNNRNKNYLNNFQLFQNYPNPFNPVTSIQYILNFREFVTLKIFDVLGKEIATLINEEKAAGKYEIKFNASKYNLSSGIYFYELRTNNNVLQRKMILLR